MNKEKVLVRLLEWVFNWLGVLVFRYEGQSINSDNGSISQKILLESELFMMQNVDMGNAYSCKILCFYHD